MLVNNPNWILPPPLSWMKIHESLLVWVNKLLISMYLFNKFILIFQIKNPFFLPHILWIPSRCSRQYVLHHLWIVFVVVFEEIEKIPSRSFTDINSLVIDGSMFVYNWRRWMWFVLSEIHVKLMMWLWIIVVVVFVGRWIEIIIVFIVIVKLVFIVGIRVEHLRDLSHIEVFSKVQLGASDFWWKRSNFLNFKVESKTFA